MSSRSRPLSWGGLIGFTLLMPPGQTALAESVTDYRVHFATAPAPPGGQPWLVLREFRRGGERFALMVDPGPLTTQVIATKGLKFKRLRGKDIRAATVATPYGRALVEGEQASAPQQDAGIRHALPPGKGVVLTIDLCPSLHPLDRRLFSAILVNFVPEEKPVPLGIAITGRWMLEHPQDLAWLRQLEADGEIAVTWINHSFNHRYSQDLPLSRNFLLEAGTDIEFEVLKTEAAMIENGLRPSVFFRFPGLVSDPKLVQRVIDFGLIPIGSDAWLAKNQVPSLGSIVLVHGNGNEPIGIDKFLSLIKQERQAIRQEDWLLFDLRQSVSRIEENP